MKQSVRGVSWSALLATLLAPVSLSAQGVDVKRMEALADSMAEAHLSAGLIPGMTVAVAQDGRFLFVSGYGQSDVEAGTDTGPETVYYITSLSKQFTAALVMRLVEEGDVSLDDPITEHLPDHPVGHQVTVRHLLNHTSGIRDYSSRHPDSPQWHRLDLSYEEMVELWGEELLITPPGDEYAYNNMGYYLLGEIIARVADSTFGEHLEQQLRPHGLEHTIFCDAQRLIPNRAGSYDYDDGQLTNFTFHSMHVFGGAGALCSTAIDLLRWNHLLFGGKLISPASLRQMTSPTVLTGGDTIPYGFGLSLRDLGGHRKFAHGGTRPGGGYVAYYPDSGLTIAVLTNSASVGREKAAEVEEVLARAALSMELPEQAVSPVAAAAYEGVYVMQMGPRTFEMRVFVEDGHLMAHPAGQEVMRLLPQGDHAFVPYQNSRMLVVFTLEDGRAEAVTVQQGQRSIQGRRRPSP